MTLSIDERDRWPAGCVIDSAWCGDDDEHEDGAPTQDPSEAHETVRAPDRGDGNSRIDTPIDLTALIERVQAGDAGARDALYAAAYPELRRLAHARLRDGAGRHAEMGATELVHESYLRFLSGCVLQNGARRAFFAYVSQVMRSVIVDAMRERQAQRRGGDWAQMTLDTQVAQALSYDDADALQVHEALAQLTAAEPRLGEVVEMRYFGGYTEAEIGLALGLTERTVRRDWEKARRRLLALLRDR